MRPGLSLSYSGRRTSRPHSVCREFPCRGPTPAVARSMMAAVSRISGRLWRRLDLPRHRPHEPGEFSGDGGANDRHLLAVCRECPEARTQSRLRLPGDLADLRRDPIELLELLRAHTRWEPVRPRALDQQLTDARVSHLGDRAAPDGLAGRSLGRDQPEVAHRLARGLEPANGA